MIGIVADVKDKIDRRLVERSNDNQETGEAAFGRRLGGESADPGLTD